MGYYYQLDMKSITQFGSIIFSAKLNDDIINEIKRR